MRENNFGYRMIQNIIKKLEESSIIKASSNLEDLEYEYTDIIKGLTEGSNFNNSTFKTRTFSENFPDNNIFNSFNQHRNNKEFNKDVNK